MNYNGGRGREISWKHVCMADILNFENAMKSKRNAYQKSNPLSKILFISEFGHMQYLIYNNEI